MEEKQTWPSLKSCKHQRYEAKDGDNDRLSLLPDEILMLIMSLFTTKEAAQTSVLSRRWNYIWRCFPFLIFQDKHPRWPHIARNHLLLPQERKDFTTLVNNVVGSHLGLIIDHLRVIFDLDVTYESHIDNWLAFALAKHVKILELDLSPQVRSKFFLSNCYTWPLESRLSSHGLHPNLVSLTSLCLKYVNVSNKDIERVLLSCHALENLSITNGSKGLENINLPQTSLQLKHLKLSCCRNLLFIDIKAPKLVSFTLHGRPIALHFRNPLSLSEVSIGNGNYKGEIVDYTYRSLSQYLSNLEYMSWHLLLTGGRHIQWNMGIYTPSVMSNLKHLELHVLSMGDQSLLGWAHLIEESLVLEKLTLTFSRYHFCTKVRFRNIVKRKGRSLNNLKTLEHFGYLGLPIDIEFATYVVENCVKLKHVIFTQPLRYPYCTINKRAIDCVTEFKNTLPRDISFTFVKPASYCCPISTPPYS